MVDVEDMTRMGEMADRLVASVLTPGERALEGREPNARSTACPWASVIDWVLPCAAQRSQYPPLVVEAIPD